MGTSKVDTNKMVAIATCVIAGAAVITGVVSLLQWDALRRGNEADQLRFVGAQRAWLTIEEVKTVPPVVINTSKGATLRLQVKVKNIGQTPATKIEVGIADCFVDECWPGHNRLAARLRGPDTITQIVLFPNDELFQQRVLSIPSDKLRVVKQPGDRTEVWFDMAIGVGYSVSGDAERHVTAFRYGVIPVEIQGEERVIQTPAVLSPSPLFESVAD